MRMYAVVTADTDGNNLCLATFACKFHAEQLCKYVVGRSWIVSYTN